MFNTQPSCLMRLAADGTVFAANDGVLALLGVKSAAGVLGQRFTAWLPPDEHERWRAFCASVLTGASASIECDITGSPGHQHPVLFHGVSLADDPGGRPLMAVAARAVGAQRQLESAIVELEMQLRQRDQEWAQARARLAEAATRARLMPADSWHAGWWPAPSRRGSAPR
jgi:PAS domain-containing protein